MTTSASHPFCVEIQLPSYTRPNLPRRAAIVTAMLHAADEIAPGHIAKRFGAGGDEAHFIYVSNEFAALRLRLRNQDLLRAAYRQ